MLDFIAKNNILGSLQILILFYFAPNSISRSQYIKVPIPKDCVKKVSIKVKEHHWNPIASCADETNCGFPTIVKDFMLIILIIKKKRWEEGAQKQYLMIINMFSINERQTFSFCISQAANTEIHDPKKCRECRY